MRPWSAVATLAVGGLLLLRGMPHSRLRIGPDRADSHAPASAHGSAVGWLVGLGIGSVFVCVAGLRPRMVLLLAALTVLHLVGRRIAAQARLRRLRRRRQRSVLAVCDGLSAELRAGLPMAVALRQVCGTDAELEQVVAAAELGGDVAGSLRGCAQRPGAERLRAVAAAFEVAGRSGTSLAIVLERVARGLREDDDARAEVLAALGPPRATARMLVLLPGFGLVLGSSIGAEPLVFLFGTSGGLACLCCGVALALLGLWWVERLADAAEV